MLRRFDGIRLIEILVPANTQTAPLVTCHSRSFVRLVAFTPNLVEVMMPKYILASRKATLTFRPAKCLLLTLRPLMPTGELLLSYRMREVVMAKKDLPTY